MARAADLLCKRLPVRRRGSTDAYYWFFGTYALYMTGGPRFEKWSTGIKKGLVKTRRRDGSWDPIGVWGEDGGPVYTTAMMTMTLMAYHRYTRLVR